jgi:hypothetical protein
MAGLARRGNGIYFSPSETDRVKIVIGGLEEEDEEGDDGFTMIIADGHHFITETLGQFNVSMKNFNEVSAKSGAQILAATPAMKPLLTVWRFGLGRVASLTVDNGRDWGSQLYGEGSSKIISSTINWIVGDTERNKDTRIECMDTRVGEETAIVVNSKKDYPEITVDGQMQDLSRLDDSNYYFNYHPTEAGFAKVETQGYECSMAINYPEEYGDFDLNSELLVAMSQITGGVVYQTNQIGNLVSDVSDFTVSVSTGMVTERKNMQLWFGIAALLLFFFDVTARRIQEIRRNR